MLRLVSYHHYVVYGCISYQTPEEDSIPLPSAFLLFFRGGNAMLTVDLSQRETCVAQMCFRYAFATQLLDSAEGLNWHVIACHESSQRRWMFFQCLRLCANTQIQQMATLFLLQHNRLLGDVPARCGCIERTFQNKNSHQTQVWAMTM